MNTSDDEKVLIHSLKGSSEKPSTSIDDIVKNHEQKNKEREK